MPAARLQSDGTAIWPALWTGPAHRMKFEVNGLGGKDMSGEKKVKRQVEGKKKYRCSIEAKKAREHAYVPYSKFPSIVFNSGGLLSSSDFPYTNTFVTNPCNVKRFVVLSTFLP